MLFSWNKKNCMIYYYPRVEDHFPWISCAMKNLTRDVNEAAMECSQTLAISYDKLSNCANGMLGNSLLYGAGVRTSQLVPKKRYVPWVVVNNLHTKMIQAQAETDLVDYVCSQYKVWIWVV